MQYMPAVPVAKAKEVRDDGSIVEVVIWELDEPLQPSTHRYKYRLYYGAAGFAVFDTTTSGARATTGIGVSVKRTTSSPRSIGCWRTSSVT